MAQPTVVLVTGGAGFIGSNLVRVLLANKGFRVVNLDKLTYASHPDALAANDNPLHHFVRGDICDEGLVANLLDEFRPQAVFHLAAESHVDRSIDTPADFVQTNVVGTYTLLEQCFRYWRTCGSDPSFRFVQISTDEVYGSLGTEGAFTERSPYAPNSPYSASKAAADHFVRAYYRTYGLPTIVTHSSNNYGPFQFREKLIPLMIGLAVLGNPLPLYGDGSHTRDWLYVQDHAQALLAVLDGGVPGEVYNIGGNCERTNRQIVTQICRLVDELCETRLPVARETLITSVADRPGHDRRYAIDGSKIRQQLGWAPQANFDAALRNTVRWFLENSAWMASAGPPLGSRQGLR